MVFDGNALSYTDLKNMDMAEWAECIAAKEMFVAHVKAKQDELAKGGAHG
jgi:hypothetical protein